MNRNTPFSLQMSSWWTCGSLRWACWRVRCAATRPARCATTQSWRSGEAARPRLPALLWSESCAGQCTVHPLRGSAASALRRGQLLTWSGGCSGHRPCRPALARNMRAQCMRAPPLHGPHGFSCLPSPLAAVARWEPANSCTCRQSSGCRLCGSCWFLWWQVGWAPLCTGTGRAQRATRVAHAQGAPRLPTASVATVSKPCEQRCATIGLLQPLPTALFPDLARLAGPKARNHPGAEKSVRLAVSMLIKTLLQVGCSRRFFG